MTTVPCSSIFVCFIKVTCRTDNHAVLCVKAAWPNLIDVYFVSLTIRIRQRIALIALKTTCAKVIGFSIETRQEILVLVLLFLAGISITKRMQQMFAC